MAATRYPAATAQEPKSEPDAAQQRDREGVPAAAASGSVDWGDSKAGRSWYIPWHELLRRTFGEEVKCPNCGGRLRLIALVKKEETIRAVLTALHFPTGPPKEERAPSPAIGEEDRDRQEAGESMDWPEEYPD